MTALAKKFNSLEISGGRYLHSVNRLPLNFSEKSVLHYLAGTQDFTIGFLEWRTHKATTIASRLSAGLTCIRKTLKNLEELGYVEVRRRFKKGTKKFLANEYKLTELIVKNVVDSETGIDSKDIDSVSDLELEDRRQKASVTKRNSKGKTSGISRGDRPYIARRTTSVSRGERLSIAKRETIFIPPSPDSSQDDFLLAGCPPETEKTSHPAKMDIISYSQKFESIFKGKGFIHYATVNAFMERLYLEKGKDQLTAFIDFSTDLVAQTYKGSIQWNENKLRTLEKMFFEREDRREEEKPVEIEFKNQEPTLWPHGPWLASATDPKGSPNKPRNSYDRW